MKAILALGGRFVAWALPLLIPIMLSLYALAWKWLAVLWRLLSG